MCIRDRSFSDRVARDRLQEKDRIGYLVFFRVPELEGAEEIAFALEREPSYAIKALLAREASGERFAELDKELTGFVGKGVFNDLKSLEKGPAKYQAALAPYY